MRWPSPGPHATVSPALNHKIKSVDTQETQVKIRIGRKLTLDMGLPAHDLITQLVVRLLGYSNDLVPIMDGRPQRLDLSVGA
jgi:hypothetical protein